MEEPELGDRVVGRRRVREVRLGERRSGAAAAGWLGGRRVGVLGSGAPRPAGSGVAAAAPGSGRLGRQASASVGVGLVPVGMAGGTSSPEHRHAHHTRA